MRPQDELEYLKGFIKLSEPQAVKRNALEAFVEDREKTLLLDADSLLFKVCHYHLEDPDFEVMYEDFHAQVREIVNTIEDDGFNVDHIIYFFTTCTNNFRKAIDPEYKANRQSSPLTDLVYTFKQVVLFNLDNEYESIAYNDIQEADDLIAEHVKCFPAGSHIICSIDKDLKQLEGAHFDYYKRKVEEDVYEYKGWSYTTPQEGYELLLKQLLIGDTSDNIKGAKGIGAKRAEKLLDTPNNFGKLRRVVEAYGDIERLRKNIKLIKL